MPFQDLDEFFDPSLHLPIRGKVYEVPSPDAETGLFCQRLMASAAKAVIGEEVSDSEVERIKLGDKEELDLYERLLGPAWGEMFTDKLPWAYIQHAGTTCLVWVTQGQAQAEEFWAANAPKAKEPQDYKRPTSSGSRGSSTNHHRKPRAAISGSTSSSTGS
jgi:hypothetical protein